MNKSILLVGNFGVGALELQYAKYLQLLNWQVHKFDIQRPVNILKNSSYLNKIKYRIYPNTFYSLINTQLIAAVKILKPTVTLVFKGMEIFPNTLVELKSYTKLLCNYNPDHPFHFYSRGTGNANIKNTIELYDLYGTYSKNIAKGLELKYKTTSYVIPFGFDNDLNNKSSKTINRFGFIGAYDKERFNILNALKDLPLDVFGPDEWHKRIKSVSKNGLETKRHGLFNKEYAAYCRESYGVLNFLRPHNIIENSHNMRTFEVPGYGGLMITNRTEEQLSFFEEDKEAIYFDSNEELKDKLYYYTKNASKIEFFKKMANQRSQKSEYSYTYRALEMSNLLHKYV